MRNTLPDTSKPKKQTGRSVASGTTQSEVNVPAAARVSGVPFPPPRAHNSHSVSWRDPDPVMPTSQADTCTSVVFLLNIADTLVVALVCGTGTPETSQGAQLPLLSNTHSAMSTISHVRRHVTFDPGLSPVSSTPSSPVIATTPPIGLSQPTSPMPTPPPLSPEVQSVSENGREDFNLLDIQTDSESSQSTQVPRRASKNTRQPRNGWHIKRAKCVGPAGNRKKYRATDVWTFFIEEGRENVCLFCMCVYLLLPMALTEMPAEVLKQLTKTIALLGLALRQLQVLSEDIFYLITMMTGLHIAMNTGLKSN